MNVFKFSNYYRAMMLAYLCCGVAFFAAVYSKGGPKIGLALVGILVVILVAYTVHAFVALVKVEGDTLSTLSFTGRRSIKLPEVEDVTRIKLKGRYIFFLMTMERYVMVSTMFQDFDKLKALIKEHMSEGMYKEIAAASDADIAKATRNRNITLFGVLLVFVGVVAYFYNK